MSEGIKTHPNVGLIENSTIDVKAIRQLLELVHSQNYAGEIVLIGPDFEVKTDSRDLNEIWEMINNSPKPIEQKRNKSDRKRNRANRWR